MNCRLKRLSAIVLTGGILMTGCSGTAESESVRSVRQPEEYGKVIALTFDDGPNTTTTVQILDQLEKYNVTASFFVVGNNVNESTEPVVRRAYEMGCEINNHSKTHSYMNKMTAEEIRKEVQTTSDKVEAITGEPTKFFRPPYIAVNQTMYDSIDLPFICGYGSNDWDAKVSVEDRAGKVLEQITDGSIILLHDSQGNDKTVEALDILIPTLLEQGYEFVTVSELFYCKGVEVRSDTDVIYNEPKQVESN